MTIQSFADGECVRKAGDTMYGNLTFPVTGAYLVSNRLYFVSSTAYLGYAAIGATDRITVNNVGVLLPIQAPTASAPAYLKGGFYFDTTLNKMRIGGAAAWETVTSA